MPSAIVAQLGCMNLEQPLSLFALSTDDGLCAPTIDRKSSVFFQVNETAQKTLQEIRPDVWTLPLNLPDGTHEWVEMQRFQAHTQNLEIGHMTETGLRVERYTPQLLTYRFASAGFHGTLVIMENEVAGTVRHEGVQYEIGGLECKGIDTGYSVLYAIADAINPPAFNCGVEEVERGLRPARTRTFSGTAWPAIQCNVMH